MRYFLYISLILLAACSQTRTLVNPPNVYVGLEQYPDETLDEGLKTPSARLLYATDRQPEQAEDSTFTFGRARSPSLGFGTVDISFGRDTDWADLKDVQKLSAQSNNIPITVASINEVARFPETPVPFTVRNGRAVPTAASRKVQDNARQEIHATLRQRLRTSAQKDVFIFVHGVSNEFSDASLTLAELWHYTGRTTVPVLYSWPAGNPGVTGYFKDREAGEYTIFHLKTFLRTVAAAPEVRNIHILAHSRGTDVVTTALRELVIEARAQGKRARDAYKIENLILAAPDLDFGVVSQRLIAEAFGLAVGQITVYMNTGDSALGLSQSLMAGVRFGRIQATDITPDQKEIFARVRNVNFVDIEGEGGVFGHTYYTRNPAVLSDIEAIINHTAKPGSLRRPLQRIEGNFWRLPIEYP